MSCDNFGVRRLVSNISNNIKNKTVLSTLFVTYLHELYKQLLS